jgi:hypothetical protein
VRGGQSEMLALVRRLRKAGVSVEQARNNHWIVRDASGRRVAVMAHTPGGGRAMANTLASLRRAGLLPCGKCGRLPADHEQKCH